MHRSGRSPTIDLSEALRLSRLVLPQEQVEPEPFAATWTALDPLAVGSASLLGVEENQGAQILTLAYHFAGDGVAAYATPLEPLLFVTLRQERLTEAILRL